MTTTDRSEDYILGQDVTAIAGSKGPKSVVVSVRLSSDDLDRLEKLGDAAGKSLSEGGRDASDAYPDQTAAG